MRPSHPPRTRYAALLFAVAMLAVLPGCAVWDFIDVRYQNATGYFNTYYNASTLFDEAMEEIRDAERQAAVQQRTDAPPPPEMPMMTVERAASDGTIISEDMAMTQQQQRPMSMAGQTKKDIPIASGAITKLDKVIEKCSRILVHYPKSKWVDNALLLIGRAYYYKREHGRAETKFRELLEGFPEGNLYGEGLLWLGRNAMAMERYDRAERYLADAITRGIERGDADVVAEAYLAQGELYLSQNDHTRAVESLRKGTEVAGAADLRIQLQLALAREEERQGNKKGAARAYRDIFRLNPDRDLAFMAEINYARLARETGQYDEAVNTLVDMLDNPTYIEFDPDIQLEIGHLYTAVQEFPSALDQYTYIDTTFRGQAVAAEASYAKGRIYEYEARDYDRAFDAYNSSKLAYPGAPGAKLAAKRVTDFGDYRKQRNTMFDIDTLLYFVLHPDSLTRRDSVQAITDSLDRMERRRSGEMSDEERLAERLSRRRPHGRNTGRINPLTMQSAGGGATATTQGAPAQQQAAQKPAGNQPLYRKLDLRTLKPDSLLTALSIARMDMGWLMFDRIGNLDSAYFYYTLALDGSLPDSMRANALYTTASIARRMGDSVLARDYEDRLIRSLPGTRYAQSIMVARGMPLPVDTAAIARSAYERAVAPLERGQLSEGIRALEQMAASYPHSEQSVRAKLAIALAYEDSNQGQKALDLYTQMVKDHPASPYSKRGKDILDAIDRANKRPAEEQKKKEEQERLAREAEEARKKAEEERQKRPPRLKEEELRAEREAAREREKKKDPTKDSDFPLNLPGEYKPKQPDRPQQNTGATPPDSVKTQTPVPITPPPAPAPQKTK